MFTHVIGILNESDVRMARDIQGWGGIYVPTGDIAYPPEFIDLNTTETYVGYLFSNSSRISSFCRNLGHVTVFPDLTCKDEWKVSGLRLKFEHPIPNPFAHYTKGQFKAFAEKLIGLACSDGEQDCVLYPNPGTRQEWLVDTVLERGVSEGYLVFEFV